MRRNRAVPIRVGLALACVAGALAAMSEPWYGPPPPAPAEAAVTLTLPLEALASDLGRWLGEPGGTSAWEAFSRLDAVLAALLTCAGVAALCCLAPGTERPARSLLQLSSLAALLMVMVKLVDPPGPNGLSEPRYGLFLAVALSALLLVCAAGVAAAPYEAWRRARIQRI